MGGKLDLEVEVKTPADKFWGAIKDSKDLFPKVFPQQYKSIEILEGDGNSVGSVRLVHFAEGIPIITTSKEKIEAADEEKKTVSYSVIDGDLINFYKTFKATFQVTPKGDGSLAKWSIEYEKANEDVPDPNLFQEFASKTFTELDAYLLKA
ncbi:MLP-like protein 423 [Magnolia sinica]|uniref:MLP-like protein 423 n=1 Tax=Magnolia sinica TaxID=86752 RepID=UPI0026585059|nr:MLP-like protein 423 [Magnolia sinica]